MRFKTRPFLLIVLCVVTCFILPQLSVLFLARSNAIYFGTIFSPLLWLSNWAVAGWIAYRRGQTSVATYLVPILLISLPTILSFAMGRLGNTYYWLWQPIKTIVLQWLGCYFLSKSFNLYLIRSDNEKKHEDTKNDRGLSIQFFLVATLMIALVQGGERWFALPSLPSPSLPNQKETLVLFFLVNLVGPLAESLVLFGVVCIVAAQGQRRLIGLGAIALYFMYAIVRTTSFMIIAYPELAKNTSVSQSGFLISAAIGFFLAIATKAIIVGVFALSGYRFVTIGRNSQKPALANDSFDSILANQQD